MNNNRKKFLNTTTRATEIRIDTKFAIFVVIGSLLVMAIYSSSTNFVSAADVTACAGTTKAMICTVFEEKTLDVLSEWDCKLNTTTKKWSCVEVTQTTKTGSDIPTELKSAIDAAKQETQNNTNDSKDVGEIKTDKGIAANPIQ